MDRSSSKLIVRCDYTNQELDTLVVGVEQFGIVRTINVIEGEKARELYRQLTEKDGRLPYDTH